MSRTGLPEPVLSVFRTGTLHSRMHQSGWPVVTNGMCLSVTKKKAKPKERDLCHVGPDRITAFSCYGHFYIEIKTMLPSLNYISIMP